MKKKLALIEDDESLGSSLSSYLEKENYEVILFKTMADFKSFEQIGDFKLLILDWMLPDGQGIDLLKYIRPQYPLTPIIMLTARTETIDKVLGLESGADDYITKPFNPRELLARIRAQLRLENDNQVNGSKIKLGDLLIDNDKREIFYKQKLVEFTKMEYELLKLFAESPNRAFSREELLNKVWGYDNYPTTRTVDTHVLQLRNKTNDKLIETIRGIGYKLKH